MPEIIMQSSRAAKQNRKCKQETVWLGAMYIKLSEVVESYVAAYQVSCGAQPYRDSMCFHCSPSSCPDTQYDVSEIRKRRMMSA